jgi:hypothetical protein
MLRGDSQHCFWSRKLDKTIPAEPTIKDVCEHCNNVVLSDLDAYICTLYDKYFGRVLEKGEKVTFKFHFDSLARWLLKLSYNSARTESSFDALVFEPLTNFILNQQDPPADYFRVFVQLQYPGHVPKSDRDVFNSADFPPVFYPAVFRAGHMVFALTNGSRKILRAIHLCSYTFLLAFFEPEKTGETPGQFTEIFLHLNKRTKLLTRNLNRVKLICGEEDAWESIKAARGNSVVFNPTT